MTAPPITRRGDTVETLHGHRIADPYRWLEDPDSEETRAWVREQAAYAEAWLAGVPARSELREQLTAIWDRPTHTAPYSSGGRWFQWRNTGLQPQPVLYTGPAPRDIGTVLLDPNTLSEDGTTAVGSSSVSRDGRLLAYSTSDAGSDWLTFRVLDLETHRLLPDVIERARFSDASWLADGSGFYYNAPQTLTEGRELTEAAAPSRVLLHVLGTAQDEDTVVFATPEEPEWFHYAYVTDDGRWTVVAVNQGTGEENQLHVRRVGDTGDFTALVPDLESTAVVVASTEDSFTVFTNDRAERSRVVRIGLERADRDSWQELIPEEPATLVGVQHLGGRLVCSRLRDGAGEVVLHDLSGARLGMLPVATATTVAEINGEHDQPLIHYATTSALDPGTSWQHDLATGETTLLQTTPVALDLGELVQEQVFVTSRDGTQLPVFLTRRRDAVKDGETPAVVYGYGGFSVPLTPAFSPTWALWVQRGGIYAQACLRGGGEYGTAWHDAGRLQHKEDVFDDACAVAEWLHSEGWSRPGRTGITGRSNGGLLAGACLTRRPELFGAVVPEVGVHDLLRFHLFTIGWAWKSDYGDPEVEQDFLTLLRYSPLHNVVDGAPLPPVLITTGDHDDRVVPAHSFKFAATLQAAVPADSGPVLLRVDIAAGHGAGKPTAKSVAERADVLAFLESCLRR